MILNKNKFFIIAVCPTLSTNQIRELFEWKYLKK